MEVCPVPYQDYGVPIPASSSLAEVTGLVDTGAQMCVGGVDLLTKLGVSLEELVMPELRISAADNAGLNVVGAVFVVITGAGGISTGQMVYIARNISELFLSQAACLELGLIGPGFPAVGEFGGVVVGEDGRLPHVHEVERDLAIQPRKVRFAGVRTSSPPPTHASAATSVGNLGEPSAAPGKSIIKMVNGVVNTSISSCLQSSPSSGPAGSLGASGPTNGASGPPCQVVVASPLDLESHELEEPRDAKGRVLAPCGCLKRELPPSAVGELPHGVVGVEGLQAWLLDHYAASSFNTCPHQPLPMMQGAKPLRIFLKEGAQPVAVHRPAVIPAHWVSQESIDRI